MIGLCLLKGLMRPVACALRGALARDLSGLGCGHMAHATHRNVYPLFSPRFPPLPGMRMALVKSPLKQSCSLALTSLAKGSLGGRR